MSNPIPVPCEPAHFLDRQNGCTPCAESTWSEGNTAHSCKHCPSGKTVAAGEGTCEESCTWTPCQPGNFLDKTKGCVQCPEGSWSVGDLTESCSPCPAGKTVAAGKGTCENDCVWRKFLPILTILTIFSPFCL